MAACMPTGDWPRPGRRQQGYSYLAVLFLVALTAAGLAALGQSWRTAAQRERERELMFRGAEIARAIAAYAEATPTPPQQYPATLNDLLHDERGPQPRHHLRRRYADPFTGEADWELVPEAGLPQRFSAVRSRSAAPLLREFGPDGSPVRTAKDLTFAARDHGREGAGRAGLDPAAAAASAAASAASAASR